MTIDEVICGMPNGFHDAHLLNISVDYRERTLQIDLNWWTGEESEIKEVREAYRSERQMLRLVWAGRWCG